MHPPGRSFPRSHPKISNDAPSDLTQLTARFPRWYKEPDTPVTLPDDNPSPLEFLYRRYGFLSVEPTAVPEPILNFDDPTAYRIVGLDPEGADELPKHLKSFISTILKGQLPAGHCDLSSSSPPDERFPGRTLIHDAVLCSRFPELSGDPIFTFVDTPNDPRLLVVHEPLSVLQTARAGTQPQLGTVLRYLLQNGCQFTLLYPQLWPTVYPRFNILTFPTRDTAWEANFEDFRDYMSRLKTFFLERPCAVAAAFSQGGIAWRIAREVLGIEGSVDAILDTYPDQGTSVHTSRGIHWFHALQEGEWFYLVGGYEILTGL